MAMPYAPLPAARVRPRWTTEIKTLLDGRIVQQFLLHFNINDYVVDLDREQRVLEFGAPERVPTGDVVGMPTPFRSYLHEFLYAPPQQGGVGCQAIYTYSLAGGLLVEASPRGNQSVAERRVYEANTFIHQVQSYFKPRNSGQPAEGEEADVPTSLPENLKLLGHILRRQYDMSGAEMRAGQRTEEETPVAVVLDFVEKLIPFRLGEGQGEREQLQALETVQRWAFDTEIRHTMNVIVMLTTNIGLVPTSVYAQGSGCRAIRILMPDSDERAAYIRWKSQDRDERTFVREMDPTDFGSPTEPERQIKTLARMTQGMRLSDIDGMSRRVIVKSQRDRTPSVLHAADVQREKAGVIVSQSENLLEIVNPTRGFREIGGLEKLKSYLKQCTEQMRQERRTPLVPNGLLLAGPPGTGKTIIAEALALESGFNLVKMRSIREKWVGSSERNLELVLNLLMDLRPVVVFIDEIDQAMGRRDVGTSGDSGVGARMFGRVLEVMSDPTRRGQILWVAATNRADVLDEALLRRFDRVVPLLAPDEAEAARIFEAMPDMIRKQSNESINLSYGPDLHRQGAFAPVARAAVAMGLTGAGIEVIVRRSAEIACERILTSGGTLDELNLPPMTEQDVGQAIADYLPNHNADMYDLQSLLAIQACNFRSIMPELTDREVFRNIRGPRGGIDPQRLAAEIVRLRAKIAQSAPGYAS